MYVTPAAGADEAEFNRWFDEVHVPQIRERVAGFVHGERFTLAKAQVAPAEGLPAHRYLNIWDVETDDLQYAADRLLTALGDGTLDGSPTVDVSVHPPAMIYYKSASPA